MDRQEVRAICPHSVVDEGTVATSRKWRFGMTSEAFTLLHVLSRACCSASGLCAQRANLT